MKAARLGFLTSIVFLLACTASPLQRVAPSPTPIPWIDAPPGALRVPTPEPLPTPPPGTPPCDSRELSLRFINYNGAGGHDFAAFEIASSGTTTCVLSGQPTGQLFDSHGGELGGAPQPSHVGTATAILVSPNQPATLSIDWSHVEPVACSIGPMVAPASLLLKLPSGAGELTARLPGTRVMEPCSGWAMSPFQNPQAFSTPNWPPAFDGLSVSLRLPTEVRAGAILDYQVKLTNDGEQSVPLIDWCPNYVDTLTSSTGQVIAKEGHRLNCATDIPPGGIVRFDIHVAVPPSVVAGRYEVNWELGFPSNRAVAGRAALAVYQ